MSEAERTAAAEEPSTASQPWAALWRNIIHIDRAKVNRFPIAFRNSLAVAIPLAIGIGIGNPLGGVAVATGALNVSYSDGSDPYGQRARRMLAWSVIGAFAVFTGSITRSNEGLATLITFAWAFIAGLQLSISTRAGDLGLNTLVALIVFSARGPSDLRGIIYGTLLVLGGGLLQTAMALLFWPISRHEPERRAIGSVYEELARGIAAPSSNLLAAPLSQPKQEVQDTLNALGRDYTVEGERFRYLFDQVDRMRLSAFSLARSVEKEGIESSFRSLIYELFSIASQLTLALSNELVTRRKQPAVHQWSNQLEQQLERIHGAAASGSSEAAEASAAADVFAGQIRAAARIAESASPDNLSDPRLKNVTGPREELSRWLGTLRANISFASGTFRHAVRMAVCVALADSISRAVSWQRSYWIPMTVAVILKPDFTTTLSRGLLRLLGTLAGLTVATVLYHAIPPSALTELLLVGVFTFTLRMFGPANYGIFSVAISGLIVFLIAETGIAPAEVVALRGINTIAGGLLALMAYLLWPTWERERVSETFAAMLDATRSYFQAVMTGLLPDAADMRSVIEEARQDWRRTRSNAEGSVDKVSSEPRTSAERLACLTSMLASSHALAQSIREMEAQTLDTYIREQSPELRCFREDVEFTLYYLSAALRGSEPAAATLPKLREDYTRLARARSSLGAISEPVLLGSDRITTTLNTLREQVARFLGIPEPDNPTTPAR